MKCDKCNTEISDFLNCALGLYRIYWKSGGSSLASVGNDYSGNRWIAPINWTCKVGGNPTGLLKHHINDVEKMEKIDCEN